MVVAVAGGVVVRVMVGEGGGQAQEVARGQKMRELLVVLLAVRVARGVWLQARSLLLMAQVMARVVEGLGVPQVVPASTTLMAAMPQSLFLTKLLLNQRGTSSLSSISQSCIIVLYR